MNIVFHAGYYAEPWDSDTSGLGGTEQCIINLSKQLAISGHQVYVVGNVNRKHNKYIGAGDVYYTPLGDDILPEIDVLIGVSYLHYLQYYTDISENTIKIFWLHNEEPHYWFKGERMDDEEIQSTYNHTEKIVCLTEWHKKYFLANEGYDIDEDKVVVIGNGIDTTLIEKPAEKEKDSYVYTSHAERGLSLVLDDFQKGYIEGTLHIATPSYGVEYYEKYYAKRVEKMDNVVYHGNLSAKDLYSLLSRMETWYYPTQYKETYCITALEMLAHHVKPLVNPIAGLRETLGKFHMNIQDWNPVDEYIQSRDWSNVMEEWMTLFQNIDIPKAVTMIDKAYVISMDTSAEALEKYKQRILEGGIDCEVEIIPGVDARTFNDYEWHPHDGWAIDSDNKWWNQPVTVGEMGCGLAHLNAWKKVVEDKVDVAVIFEEDFYFTDKLDESIIPPTDEWHMIYLGRTPMAPDQEDRGDLVVPGYSYNLHAYMVTGAGALSFTQHNFQNYITTPDEFIPATYVRHPRGDWDWVTRDTKALSLKKHIASQTSNDLTSRTQSTVNTEIFKSGQWSKWIDRWIHPAAKTKAWDMIIEEPITDVISFPLFTEEFCELLIDEAEKKAYWQEKRHDFYPTVDTLISSFGYEEIYKKVLHEWVFPAAIHRWDLHGKHWANMTSENFMIKYTTDTQGHLDLHHDNAVISSVLTLNKDFTGGGTYFYNQKKTHVGEVGHITIHPGQVTHRHGGRPVYSGKRYILVSFCNKP